jgi:hypothetical protein
MSDNNIKAKATREWALEDLKIVEWEKYNKNNAKYFQYSITKTQYNKPETEGGKGTFNTVFSISLNSKKDLVAIEYLLNLKPKETIEFASYSFGKENIKDPNDLKYILTKEYTDYKTNENKTQTAVLVPFEILCLLRLVRKVMDEILVTITIKNGNSNNNSYDNSAFADGSGEDYYGQSNGNTGNGNNQNSGNNQDNNKFNELIDDDIPF